MLRAIAVAILGIVATSIAQADDEYFGRFIVDPQHPEFAVLAGPIEHNAPLDFRRMIRAYPDIATVALHSVGGDVTAGLLLAQEVHERGISTFIAPDSFCYSACSYVFLAGKDRLVEGALGVHQMANDDGDIYSVQVAISDLLDTLGEFDVPDRVISDMLRTPPQEMTVYDAAAATELGLNRLTEAVADAPPDTGALSLGFQPGINVNATDEDGISYIHPSLPQPARAQLWTEVDQYAGEVWWSTTLEGGNTAMVAEAAIPKMALDAKIIWRKNTDAAVPAMSVMTVQFSNYSVVEVEQIAGVLVKDDMAATGTPLFGASAKTGERSFVFALSADDGAGYTNAYMLNDHQNIDLALVLKNGRNALLTLQKDDEARIKFREVLESWAE
ncbi:hypothetical protein [Devosia marina]|uniref:Periplasmic protein-like protein n=1 Tax=Devosia marina TaxID=2683198 RepID=A0A7X3K393_9HYPH|nr:hypothetical protein [Devosia marina]MVS99277.1 hypothetical protein [Devosia marina]